MKRFFTADLHFNHANICRYCNRPYIRRGDTVKDELTGLTSWTSQSAALACAERMNKGLISNLNGRIKEDDMVIHVGDFMTHGWVKGDEGLKLKTIEVLKELNGHWTLLKGNHDANNSVKAVANYMMIDIGPYKAFVSHYPLENFNVYNPKLVNYVIDYMDFQITAHVHNSWKSKFIETNGKKFLMYNVGIDVHKLYPIHDAEIIEDVNKIKKNL